jgi:predicted MFS family arabinose efflux permease
MLTRSRTERQSPLSARAGSALVLRAVSLSFGAAIALGLARFSYALLLPPMKTDLGWTFAQAGALNTANAAGYLAGALVFPILSRQIAVHRLLLGGCLITTLLMVTAGFTIDVELLVAQRLACGVASALVFVAGGVLATRLAAAHPLHSGLVLGLYYGGVGWGIALSALIVPWSRSTAAHGWQAAWIALAVGCAVCSALAWPTASGMSSAATGSLNGSAMEETPPPHARRYIPLLAAYCLYGIGYIGYMTFVIALLRAAGMGAMAITVFYELLGLSVVASARLWSGVLHRARGGGALSLFCLLLAAATLVPALTRSPAAAFASGIVFGATFLSVVTATTAFVRHNLPASRWSAGISLFTIVFALGQIVGPIVMGRISDGTSLSGGFVASAIVMLVAAAIGIFQKPLSRGAPKQG